VIESNELKRRKKFVRRGRVQSSVGTKDSGSNGSRGAIGVCGSG